MRRCVTIVCSVLICLVPAYPCLAQGAAAGDPVIKNYVMSYFLVGAGVALGLVAICRPSKRRTEVRRPAE